VEMFEGKIKERVKGVWGRSNDGKEILIGT
jgi:hypothetical protein